MHFNQKDIVHEFTFVTSRSSGKGGQHVNKTESRVSAFFNVVESQCLNETQKECLLAKLQHRIHKESIIQVDVEATRSQLKNKEIAIKRMIELINENLKQAKKRKPTKPNKKAIQKRLKEKKRQAEKKQNRKAL